ncbi:MAG TPA: protease pro-enzyme activation domain-containing protein, partial [Gemmatimonadaceae bacterium]
MRDLVRNGQAQSNGRLPQNQMMNLNIVLPVRDQAGLDRFVAEVYDPASANYRHFLTPQEFTARFGPTQSDYNAVLQFAQMNGLTVTGGSRDGMDVQVRGSAAAVEAAFHVRMQTYRHPKEDRNFFSPDQEPTTDLAFNLWHVSGLDNYSMPHPLVVSKSAYAAAMGIDANKVVSHATTGSGPSASFLGSDMRAAYYGSGSLTGAGQNLGLLEYLGTNLKDLQTYYSNVGQTYPGNIITLLSTDGTSTSCSSPGCDDTEQNLDMTQALGMAPGLASLTMYVGSTDTAIISAMTTHNPLPTTIGCSWGWTPADPGTLNPYFQKMAAQGQSFFTASGDNSTWTKTGKSEAWPGDNAYVITVGGTDLVTSGAAGPWASETAWVDSGGGISPDSIAIPSWQQIAGVINSSNRGSTTLRNGPDVSANANFTFYTCADQTSCLANSYGGTSFAAPMWAGYLALVNQQLAANSQGPAGFINPTIYQQNVGSSYATDFHDITSGTSGSYSAVTGYDLVTGWGSPTPALVNALAGTQTQTPDFTIAANPGSVTVTQGSSGNSTISISGIGGFSSAVALSASNMPAGVTVGFNPTSISGSQTSTATFTVASSVQAGTYSITITGTSGSLQHSTTVNLTVSGTQSSYSIAASPTSLTVTRGSSGSSTITLSGTVTGAVTFSASGLGSGETVTFTPSSLSAAGTTT